MIRYIDLCCGIGGFRVAIEQIDSLNFECVFSSDIKHDALDTYNVNFKESITPVDLFDVEPEQIPAFDLLCAGFPCQPFSSAGHKKGFDDDRGGMIFKIIDICAYHKPNVVFLENVYNLLTLDHGQCIQRIRKLFEDLGYNVYYEKLNSKDFGCPQSRERVYIVCTKTSFKFPINIQDTVLLKHIIDYSDKRTDIDNSFANKLIQLHKKQNILGCKMGDKRGGMKNIHSWDLEYNGPLREECKTLMNKIMLERRKKHWAKQKGVDWMDGMPLTLEDIHTFYKSESLKEMLDDLVEKKHLRLEKCKVLVNGKREYKLDSETGYNICKGKLSFPVSQVLDFENIAPTLTATDSHKLVVLIDNTYIRRLNTLELKRICGFPDDFVVPEKVNAFDLFGNMATPPVLKGILESLYC